MCLYVSVCVCLCVCVCVCEYAYNYVEEVGQDDEWREMTNSTYFNISTKLNYINAEHRNSYDLNAPQKSDMLVVLLSG